MVRVALVGLGKMGLSHLAIARTHPDVEVVAASDPNSYVLDAVRKFSNLRTYASHAEMFAKEQFDALIVSTPSRFHQEVVQAALMRGVHVFCEKPFCLDVEEGRRLAEMAEERNLVNQVGYHARFIATFQEARRIVDSGVLGRIHHVKAEAYGAVVLRPSMATWRSSKKEGGGCLYDYASHAVDLLDYLVGPPDAVTGSLLRSVFSRDVDDEVYTNLVYPGGMTGQVEANWSDESFRKMYLRITVWGTNGRVAADRQEIQTHLRSDGDNALGLKKGWTVRYTTELTKEVWYYLRGEEYSAQIDHFIRRIRGETSTLTSTFATANDADRVLAMIAGDAAGETSSVAVRPTDQPGSMMRSVYKKLTRR